MSSEPRKAKHGPAREPRNKSQPDANGGGFKWASKISVRFTHSDKKPSLGPRRRSRAATQPESIIGGDVMKRIMPEASIDVKQRPAILVMRRLGHRGRGRYRNRCRISLGFIDTDTDSDPDADGSISKTRISEHPVTPILPYSTHPLAPHAHAPRLCELQQRHPRSPCRPRRCA